MSSPGFQAEFVFRFHGPGIPDISQGFFQDGGAFYGTSLVIDVGGGEAHRVSRDNGAAGEDVIGGMDIYISAEIRQNRKGAVLSMRQIDFRHEALTMFPSGRRTEDSTIQTMSSLRAAFWSSVRAMPMRTSLFSWAHLTAASMRALYSLSPAGRPLSCMSRSRTSWLS